MRTEESKGRRPAADALACEAGPTRALSLARARPSSSPNQTLINSWSPGEENRVLHTFCPPAGHRFFIFPMSSAVCRLPSAYVRLAGVSVRTVRAYVRRRQGARMTYVRTTVIRQATQHCYMHACCQCHCMHVFITRHPRPCSHADNLIQTAAGRGMVADFFYMSVVRPAGKP